MKYLLIAISCICAVTCQFAIGQSTNDARDSMSSESSQPQSNTVEISIKDEFGILYQQLKEIRGGYDADVMKTVAFLIIAIGWFITSEKSRDFFRKNRTARILSLYAVVVICCIHVWYSVLTYFSSHKLISSIKGTTNCFTTLGFPGILPWVSQ